MSLNIQQIGIVVLAAIAACTLFVTRKQLMDALENMRGGPRPPTHPLPGNDGFVVLRKRQATKNDGLPHA